MAASRPLFQSWAWALVWLPTIPPPLLGVLFGAGGAGFRIAYVLAVGLLFGYCWALRNRPIVLFGGFLIWLTIERFIVAMVSNSLVPDTLQWLLVYKEFFFPFLFLVGLPRAREAWSSASRIVRVVDVCAVCFGALILLAFVLSSAPLDLRATYARRLAELPLIYLAGRLMRVGAAEIRAVAALIVAIAVPVAVFGFLEDSVLQSLIWRTLVPAAHYYHLSTLAGLSAPGTDSQFQGLPIVFWDYTLHVYFRRLVSTFLEATTLSAFLAFATAVALSFWPKRKMVYAIAAVLALATALTLGKAGLVILVVAGGYALLATIWRGLRRRAAVAAAGIVVVVGIFALVGVAIAANFTTGSLDHVRGFADGLSSAAQTPLGNGLGVGGNFGTGHAAAESSVAVILVQLGVPGAVLWGVWLVGLALACADSGKRSGMELPGLTLGVAVLAFFATAVFTESAGGLLGNWPYALVPAILVGLRLGIPATARDESRPSA